MKYKPVSVVTIEARFIYVLDDRDLSIWTRTWIDTLWLRHKDWSGCGVVTLGDAGAEKHRAQDL